MTSRIPWPSIRPSLRAAIGQQPWQCSRRLDGSRCQSLDEFMTICIIRHVWYFDHFMFNWFNCIWSFNIQFRLTSDLYKIFWRYWTSFLEWRGVAPCHWRSSLPPGMTSTAPSPSPSAWPTDLWSLCQRKMPKRKHDRLRNFRRPRKRAKAKRVFAEVLQKQWAKTVWDCKMFAAGFSSFQHWSCVQLVLQAMFTRNLLVSAISFGAVINECESLGRCFVAALAAGFQSHRSQRGKDM